jgi:phosphoglycolate phosphatase-like HAD superfamily hydrolase
MIRGVLFDLDGTLIDTWDLYVEAYIRSLEPHFGRRLSLEELLRLRPTSEIRVFQRALAPPEAAAAHREFLRHYRALHPTHFGGLYAGVPELLAALRGLGLPLGLVTGKSRPAWEITASLVALGPFQVVVTDEDVREAKPDPEGLFLALGRLGIAPAEALYVGDSVGDAQAAHAAGVPFAAALWPKTPEERRTFLARVPPGAIWRELAAPDQLIRQIRDSARPAREPARGQAAADRPPIPNDQDGTGSA